MKNGKIGGTTENIFPVIKKFLYSDHEIFLRELVSNAVDATQKLKTLSSKGEFKGELGDTKIHVSVDAEKKTLTVRDRGIGMTADDVVENIGTIAKSGTKAFLKMLEEKGEKLVGILRSFNVKTHIVNISRGPTVTRYELQPSAGVKISKITNLADDIALNLDMLENLGRLHNRLITYCSKLY